MRLHRLSLLNYRNYAEARVEFSAGLNCFFGQNAQGKTNLLEAISLLSLSSSPRTAREADLVGPAGTEAKARAEFAESSRLQDVEITIRLGAAGTRKLILVNGARRAASQLPGEFPSVLFWPDDLDLVKAGPEARRRLLNRLLVQVERGYAENLVRYGRALEQRNRLLKRVTIQEAPAAELAAWEEQMARHGAPIIRARRQAVDELAGIARERHRLIRADEELDLKYEPSADPDSDLAGILASGRATDLARGSTAIGPHRDDIAIRLQGHDARARASQAQQRSAVVSIKLAEAMLMSRRLGEEPVVLLDDVLSELDSERLEALLSVVARMRQVVVTSADGARLPGWLTERASVRTVISGRII